MNSQPHRAGWVRRVLGFLLDVGMGAGIGFILMWPLGAFEGQGAYVLNQIVLRIIGLIILGFIVHSGWLLAKKRQTLGRRIMGIGAGDHGSDKPLRWRTIILRLVVVALVSIAPFATLVTTLMWARWTA